MRDAVFEAAGGEFVLCMDCHVLIVPGALSRLLAYMKNTARAKDLLQGPLVRDDLISLSTHFQTAWRGGMFGHWGTDARASDLDGAPFDIPMEGLGLSSVFASSAFRQLRPKLISALTWAPRWQTP